MREIGPNPRHRANLHGRFPRFCRGALGKIREKSAVFACGDAVYRGAELQGSHAESAVFPNVLDQSRGAARARSISALTPDGVTGDDVAGGAVRFLCAVGRSLCMGGIARCSVEFLSVGAEFSVERAEF